MVRKQTDAQAARSKVSVWASIHCLLLLGVESHPLLPSP